MPQTVQAVQGSKPVGLQLVPLTQNGAQTRFEVRLHTLCSTAQDEQFVQGSYPEALKFVPGTQGAAMVNIKGPEIES